MSQKYRSYCPNIYVHILCMCMHRGVRGQTSSQEDWSDNDNDDT